MKMSGKMSHILFFIFSTFFIFPVTLIDVEQRDKGRNTTIFRSLEYENISENFLENNHRLDLRKIFDVWSPEKLLAVWEKRHEDELAISLACRREISWYLEGVSTGTLWAMKMDDASGRPTPGILSGSTYWVGAPDQCREMEKQVTLNMSSIVRPDIPPFKVSMNSIALELQILMYGLNTTYNITLGLCLPSSCKTTDTVELLKFYLNNTEPTERRISIDHVRNLSEGYNIWDDPVFYIILVCFALAVLFAVLGTVYDVALRYQFLTTEKSVNSPGNGAANGKSLADDGGERITLSRLWSVKQHNRSLDVWNTKQVPKPLSEAILSFSLLLNLSKVMSLEVGLDTLAAIHGLRVISMMWIILVHTCLIVNAIADTNMFKEQAERDFLYQTISNGAYSVDTFFFISGCLVAFLYFRTMSTRQLEKMRITKGITGKFMQFLGMMVYRYIRLTPPYLLIIGLIQVSMKWYHDHSMVELPSTDHEMCEKYWWRNALYINTYFPMNERCIPWSWYLANDTQFYTIGSVILIVSASFISIGAAIGVLFLIASWITTSIITINTHHIPTIEDPFANYDSLYDKPWSRMGPYLIGMATGWYLYNIECKLKLNKIVALIGWTLSIATLSSIVYGLYWKTLGPVSSAMYTALSHSGWAVGLAWILVACVTGNGGIVDKILSWKYIYPLSRLTYCSYLIHPALTRALVLHGEHSLHLTQELITILFFGITVASYAASLFFSLLFEAPMVSLLRIAHPHRQWKSK